MNRRTLARRTAAGTLAVLATMATSYHSGPERHDLDVAAVAVASSAEPTASDTADVVSRLGGRSSTVQSTSTATSDCDGCAATSSAVTVVYVGAARSAHADNVAHAWSSCVDCASRSVSVQVVVLRRATTVHAANRAFAATVSCERCTTSAAAYQLVVLAPGGRTLGRHALGELEQWAREQAAAAAGPTPLRQAAPAAPGAGGTERLDELQDRTLDALGGATVLRRDVDTSTAPR